MSKPVLNNTKLILYGIFAAIISCADFAVLYFMYTDEISLVEGIIVHSCISIFLGIVAFVVYKADGALHFPLLLLLATATMGAFGALFTLLTIILYALYLQNALSFGDWIASLFPEEDDEYHDIYERLRFGWEDFSNKHNVTPFKDVMLLGTDKQKHEALTKIARHFKPVFASTLLIAVNDSSNSVRVQAATIIAKLRQDFSGVIIDMENSLQKEPEKFDLLYKLAEQYDSYAYSGLLEESREQEFRAKSLGYFHHCLEHAPGDTDILFSIGRLYLSIGECENAYQAFREYRANKKHMPSNVIPWVIESLYKQGRLRELREFATKYLPETNSHTAKEELIQETVLLWAKGLPENVMDMA